MKKILIIEDDAQLRENISDILTLSGYDVITAAEGKTGVERALKESPDLVLCDVVMPMLDGYGVLHIISRHPDMSSTPFIFLTGKIEPADIRKGMSLGADDYLFKPFNDTDLLDSIEIRLRKSTKRQNKNRRADISEFFTKGNEAERKNTPRSGREINTYSKKQMLFNANQIPRYVYYVVTGKLKQFNINDDGKELIINIYSKGDFLGYKEVLQDTRYFDNVQVIEEAELLLIPKSDFIQLVDEDQGVAREFLTLLCNNLREKEERLIGLAYSSLRKKAADAIIQVIEKFKDQREGKPSVEISREDLSHIIGSAPESTIRTLKEFKDERLIEVSDGSIIILNEGKLRNLLY